MTIKNKAMTFAGILALGSLGLWGLNSCSLADNRASLPEPAELIRIEGIVQDSSFDRCAYTYRPGKGSGKRCRAVAYVRVQVGEEHIDMQTARPLDGVELSSLADPKLIGRPVKALIGRPCSKIEISCAYEFVVAGDRLVTMSDQQERQAREKRKIAWMNGVLFALFLIGAASNVFAPTSLHTAGSDEAS